MTDETKEQIEELVMDVYDIGHAHGSAPLLIAQGKEPRRKGDGWGAVAEKIMALVEREVGKANGE